MLFETSWRNKYTYYERYFCEKTQTSIVKKINNPAEWYKEDSRGQFRSIIDDNITLKKFEGSPKDGRDHWGFKDPIYRNIRDTYWNEHQKETYNHNARVLYLDIETRVGTNSSGFPKPELALEPISLIQLFDSKNKTMYILGLRDWVHKDSYKFNYDIKYIKLSSEIELINTFVKVFQKLNPLIIYAWNGNGFDYPYIYNRMEKLGIDVNGLSVYGDVNLKSKTYGAKTVHNLESHGHHFMDLLEIYKKFTFSEQSSYSLDYTAKLLLGHTKVQHTEYTNFDDFYTGKYNIPENPTEEQKNSKIYQAAIKGDWDEVKELAHSEFVYYGAIDTHLIKEIDEAKNFTMLIMMIVEKMGILISDSLGTVTPWSHFLSNKANLRKQIIPKVHVDESNSSIKGGFVREPIVGKHRWIVSGDYNSMYPLIGMVGFNASAETYVPIHKLPPELKTYVLKYYNNENEIDRFDIPNDVKEKVTELLQKHNFSLAITGAVYKKDKLGMIPEIVQEIYTDRKTVKKLMFRYEQKSIDIKSAIDKGIFGTKNDTDEILNVSDYQEYTKEFLTEQENFCKGEKAKLFVKQIVLKTLINSLYGALANKYFPLFNVEIARSITGNGRYLIQATANDVIEKLNEMIPYNMYAPAGDTDSVYFSISPFVDRAFENKPDASITDKVEFCDKFYNSVIDPIIQNTINVFAKEQNMYNSSVVGCEREIIADRAVYTAKKKYFARVIDSEGVRYNPYKMKVMGLDIIRSGTPIFVKEKLQESLNIMLDSNEDEMISWKDSIKQEFCKANLNDIAKSQGVSNIDYDLETSVGIPFGARTALVHNKFIIDNNLQNEFDLIGPGDKVKLMYLKEPNIFNSNAIAWKQEKFTRYIKDCVNYEFCFEKFFISPLELMTLALNWNIQKTTESLDEW